MIELKNLYDDLRTIIELEVEELSFILLSLLKTRRIRELDRDNREPQFSIRNLRLEIKNDRTINGNLSRDELNSIDQAMAEAYMWLVIQGMFFPIEDGGNASWYSLSRKALKIEDNIEFKKYQIINLLPREILHHSIANKVWASFIRGEFENAVFTSMKAVEVSVRNAADYSDADLGTKLMRKAFDPDNGPLSDLTTEKSEREAQAHLFAGAIGLYKNPSSHRNVNFRDPIEAIEVILLANQLLRIIDRISKRHTGTT